MNLAAVNEASRGEIGLYMTHHYISCMNRSHSRLWAGAGLTWGSVIFVTFGGLRGTVSLILAQMLVLDQENTNPDNRRVTAEVHLSTSISAPQFLDITFMNR